MTRGEETFLAWGYIPISFPERWWMWWWCHQSRWAGFLFCFVLFSLGFGNLRDEVGNLSCADLHGILLLPFKLPPNEKKKNPAKVLIFLGWW